MDEARVIFLLASGPLLWMIGGTWWKPARRYVWPVAAGLALFSTVAWWRVFLAVAGLIGVNTLPYGDRTPAWARGLVFVAYALPSLCLSLDGWWIRVGLCGGLLAAFFWLSRKDNKFTWKIWEAEAGLLQAATLIMGV